jgi:hypothetical protein
MSSAEYLAGFLAMAILIPGIVHGGITWAYFRSKQQMSPRPAGEAAEPHRRRRDEAHGTDRMTAATPSAIKDDGRVPEKQIWRWQDDGGVVGSPS